MNKLIESVRNSETQLNLDYDQLRKLHNQLSKDYDLLMITNKEIKESHRYSKLELQTNREQIAKLTGESERVKRLGEALEQERGSLKGRA